MLALEFYPLGKIADRMFWKHTREVLDFHGCNDRAEEENPELKKMLAEDGGPKTSHTTNPVPLWVTVPGLELRSGGRLADLAPTVLELMGLSQPDEMTGTSLIV